MERLGFLEILDRRGRVSQRHQVGTAPITIGRAYDNDVILDDPFVSPHHLRVEWQDETAVVVEDLGSENGLFTEARLRVPQLDLTSGISFRIGHTELRYSAADAPVAPTVVEHSERFDLLAVTRGSRSRMVVLLIALATFALIYFQSSYEEVTWSEATGGATGGLLVLALWAGVWAFAGRVVSHQFRFWPHLVWATLLTLVFLVMLVAFEYLEFLFTASTATGTFQGLITLGLFALGFYGHFTIVGTMPLKRRLVVTAWISVGLITVLVLFSMADKNDFSNEIPWSGTLKPLGRSILPSVTVEEFRQRAVGLQEKVDRMAD